MRVSILFLFIVTACASAPKPTVIENDSGLPPAAPSVEGNLAATVTVYYEWRHPLNQETMWDSEYAVVLDSRRVLTKAPENMGTSLDGWEGSMLFRISVGPYAPRNESGVGPWSASMIGCDKDYAVLMTEDTLPIAPVTLAKRQPHIDDAVYYVAENESENALKAFDGRIYGTVTYDGLLPGETHAKSAEFLIGYDSAEDPGYRGSVFNAKHEFVGLTIDSWDTSSVITRDGARYHGSFAIVTAQGLLHRLMAKYRSYE